MSEREAVGDLVITDLRAVGIDEKGSALYLVRVGQPDDTDAPRTLRLSDGLTTIDVATERATLPGTDKTLISIESQRLNRRGDVAFIAELGRIDGLTTIIEEVRAEVRLADGTYLAPVSTARPGNIGTLSNFEIAGFDDNANLLLIATRSPEPDRAGVRAAGRSGGRHGAVISAPPSGRARRAARCRRALRQAPLPCARRRGCLLSPGPRRPSRARARVRRAAGRRTRASPAARQKCVAAPERTCSMRPAKSSGAAAVRAWNWITKARCVDILAASSARSLVWVPRVGTGRSDSGAAARQS